MSVQQKPVIHARDHAYGGADPLGIAWEDVGDSGGGSGGDVTGLEWWRFATFTSTSYVTIGGGIGPCFSWASKVASYEGEGGAFPVADIDPTLSHLIQLAGTGTYRVMADFHLYGIGSVEPRAVSLGVLGSGWRSPGVAIAPSAGTTSGWDAASTAAGTFTASGFDADFWRIGVQIWPPTPPANVRCALTVVRIGPP